MKTLSVLDVATHSPPSLPPNLTALASFFLVAPPPLKAALPPPLPASDWLESPILFTVTMFSPANGLEFNLQESPHLLGLLMPQLPSVLWLFFRAGLVQLVIRRMIFMCST